MKKMSKTPFSVKKLQFMLANLSKVRNLGLAISNGIKTTNTRVNFRKGNSTVKVLSNSKGKSMRVYGPMALKLKYQS